MQIFNNFLVEHALVTIGYSFSIHYFRGLYQSIFCSIESIMVHKLNKKTNEFVVVFTPKYIQYFVLN